MGLYPLALSLIPLCLLSNSAYAVAPLFNASQLPLSTSGPELVDQNGNKAKLACINWYGAHMETYVVNGLHKRTLSGIVNQVCSRGSGVTEYAS